MNIYTFYKFLIFNSILWKVDNHITLFGTCHNICIEELKWSAKLDSLLKNADTLYLEYDINKPSVQVSEYYSTEPLSSYFTDTQYKLLSIYLKDTMGLSISSLQNIDIHLLPMFIYPAKCQSVKYEEFISSRFNKPIKGLETDSIQMYMLKHIAVDTVVKDVLSVINRSAKTDKTSLYFKEQNITALYNSIPDKELLIDSRNRTWVTKINQVKGTAFIAVGAAHLPGLIQLLRQTGHSVVPLVFN